MNTSGSCHYANIVLAVVAARNESQHILFVTAKRSLSLIKLAAATIATIATADLKWLHKAAVAKSTNLCAAGE